MTDNDWVTVFPFTDMEGKEHRIQISDRPSGDRTGVRWEYRPEGDTIWRHVWSVTAEDVPRIDDPEAVTAVVMDEMEGGDFAVDTTAIEGYNG